MVYVNEVCKNVERVVSTPCPTGDFSTQFRRSSAMVLMKASTS